MRYLKNSDYMVNQKHFGLINAEALVKDYIN